MKIHALVIQAKENQRLYLERGDFEEVMKRCRIEMADENQVKYQETEVRLHSTIEVITAHLAVFFLGMTVALLITFLIG